MRRRGVLGLLSVAVAGLLITAVWAAPAPKEETVTLAISGMT